MPGKKWICKPCRSSLLGEIKCVACDMEHPKHKTIRFLKNKYDMTDDLVYTTLHDVSDGIGNICIECDHHLCTTCVYMLPFKIYLISSTCILHQQL